MNWTVVTFLKTLPIYHC